MDSKDKKQLAKQRRETAKQAQKFHREQQKLNKKPSEKTQNEEASNSKITEAIAKRRAIRREERSEHLTREEKFRREGEKKLRNLRPQDHEEGYFIDEYAEKRRQERRAREIRRQEHEVIRRNKKPMTAKQIRLKRILISAGLFAGVLVVGVILSLTVLFKTEKINVIGDVYYEREQIIGFSNVAEGQNIFIGTKNSTPGEIVKKLPYVESAQVDFEVPDTININVKNAVPTYAIKDGDGYLIVSSKGRILDNANYITEDLIELKCGELNTKTKGDYINFGDESVSDILHSVAKSFAAYSDGKITGFDISNLSNIIINYDNRIDINIGLPDDIEYKIKTAFTIINEKLDPNKTENVAGTLDVSTCNKNKISRYKPAPIAPTTVPVTQPATGADGENGVSSDSVNDYAQDSNTTNNGNSDISYEEPTYDWQAQ